MAARKSGKSGDPLASPKKVEEPILPPVDVPKADQLAQKMAKTRAAQEMETNERVLEEEKQNFITRAEAAKEKKKKKGKAVEDDDVPSQKEEIKQNEEIKYAMGDQYDAERADLARVDYEYEQLLAKAKVKALKNNEMQVYDDLEQKKMNRAQLKLYIHSDKDKQKESVDLEQINKDWTGQDLQNPAYGEFWKDGEPRRKPSRGSQSVKRSRGGSRGSQAANMLTTPER